MAVSAERPAGAYILVAGLWIIISDAIVGDMMTHWVQTAKGLLFVLATGALLYAHIKFQVRRQAAYEKQLEEAAERLSRNLDGKSRLIHSVSHDLRQPLQSIALFALVLDGQTLTPKGREALDNLHGAVGRMADHLEAILGLARLDLGKVPIRQGPVALGPLLRALTQEMAPLAAAKKLDYRSIDTALSVCSDPVILSSMLRNLITNAIRYTERGGVLVGARRRGGQVELVVYDTGIGLTADTLPLVFEEFYQVGNLGRDIRQGLGLGLPIVQRMAHLLGHEVVAVSRPGRGSCFSIIVPSA
mgnify:CR=1 FL=1